MVQLLLSQASLLTKDQLESAFSLQEHLAALHYYHTASGTRAVTRATALQIAQPPPGIDRTLWLYELCRFLISQCNTLIVGFLFDTPPCSASTCPEMRASEWQFLCAVHEQPKSCCAIDYCCHTLDWAANVVSDQKIFPSRFVILNDTHSKNVGLKNLVNVFRRLHRIFAHAWFQHRSVFWAIEGQSGLYVFFKMVCDLYDLLPAENYKLPPEAEGLEAQPTETEATKPTPTILKPTSPQQDTASDDGLHPPGRTTTRRHVRSSPSTGSAVTTVIEAEEEETDAVTRGMNNIRLAAGGGEPEVADVPVIVDESMMNKSPKASVDAKGSESGTPQEENSQESSANDTTVTVVGVEGDDDEDATHNTSVVEIHSTDEDAPPSNETTTAEANATEIAGPSTSEETAESKKQPETTSQEPSAVAESGGAESATTEPEATKDAQPNDSTSTAPAS